MKYDVVIVAAGSGTRAKLGFNKVFYKMKNSKTVLENSAHLFIKDEDCKNVIIVTNEPEKVFKNKKIIIVEGGKRRQDSVMNGLNVVKNKYVLIHDGARPYLKKNDLENLKKTLIKEEAAILAFKEVNTVKKVKDGYISKTINRDEIYLAQTPQGFKTEVIKNAYMKLKGNYTDDASLLEHLHIKVKIVEGDPSNIKLTNRSDFYE